MRKPLPYFLLLFALLFAACSAVSPQPTPVSDPAGFVGPLPPTAEVLSQQLTPTPLPPPSATPTFAPAFAEYKVKAGDVLGAIADKYDVNVDDVMQMNGITNPNSLQVGQTLRIPVQVDRVGPAEKLIPDSELVYGPGYAGFDVNAFAQKYGGYLVGYKERVEGTVMTGPQIIQLVAERFSVGPRVLLTVLELESGWVTSTSPSQIDYAMGIQDGAKAGLYRQAFWMANALNAGYYGTLYGRLPAMTFKDRRRARFAQGLNPGTTAIQNALANNSTMDEWLSLLGGNGFAGTYKKFFGDPFSYAVEPLIPPDLKQPTMRLPIADGHLWYFTGGPHAGWVDGSAWAAVDFTPKDQAGSCWTSADWAIAAAPGKIIRAELGRLVMNISGSDFQGKGWSLLYMHMASDERVPEGTQVNTGDHIGHPSCEGGAAETSHLHFARLYNGEWIPAGDAKVPMVLSGWVFQADTQEYDGKMVRGSQTLIADNAQVPDRNGLVADGGEPK